MSKALETTIKKTSKENGYKTISGLIYKFIGDFVYIGIISAYPVDSGKMLTATLYFKPHILDQLFWEIFEVDEAKKMPLSFHVNGAITIPSVDALSFKEPVLSVENIAAAYKNILVKLEDQIALLEQTVQDLDAFRVYSNGQPCYPFMSILISIHDKHYDKALALIQTEVENHKSSGFLDSNGRDFYDYAKAYCENRL